MLMIWIFYFSLDLVPQQRLTPGHGGISLKQGPFSVTMGQKHCVADPHPPAKGHGVWSGTPLCENVHFCDCESVIGCASDQRNSPESRFLVSFEESPFSEVVSLPLLQGFES